MSIHLNVIREDIEKGKKSMQKERILISTGVWFCLHKRDLFKRNITIVPNIKQVC